jgi:hypothetical protein
MTDGERGMERLPQPHFSFGHYENWLLARAYEIAFSVVDGPTIAHVIILLLIVLCRLCRLSVVP